MGIGFSVEANIPGRGILRRKPARDQLFSEIRDVIREYVSDPLMHRMMHTDTYEHTLSVTLHPCEEAIEFTWSPNQSLRASAKTSSVGPGYHAYVIEMLRHIGVRLALDWNWDEEGADEADFVHTNDFSALQGEMARLWRSIVGVVLENAQKDCANQLVNMSLHYPAPNIDGLALTPLGPLSREVCEAIHGCDQDALIAVCRQHFVWWDKEPNAQFWRNTALTLLWCDVPWHVPVDESSLEVSKLALDCIDRAVELDGNIDVPHTELDELRGL